MQKFNEHIEQYSFKVFAAMCVFVFFFLVACQCKFAEMHVSMSLKGGCQGSGQGCRRKVGVAIWLRPNCIASPIFGSLAFRKLEILLSRSFWRFLNKVQCRTVC